VKIQKKSTFKDFLWIVCFPIAFIFCAFDWPEKPNAEVRTDMFEYISVFSNEFKNYPVAQKLNHFLTIQKAKVKKKPYAWMGDTHKFVLKLKASYPPTGDNFEIRKHILQLLDYPLHVNNLSKDITKEELEAYNLATCDYVTISRDKVLEALEAVKPTKGMVIWKVYNMGFIFRTSKHTIAIDISSNPKFYERGEDGQLKVSAKTIAWRGKDYLRLTKQIDALFLTHPHDDHYSIPLIKAMLEAGKPVVMPEQLQEYDPETKKLKPVAQDCDNLILLRRSQETPLKVAGIDVLSFHGYQDKNSVPCNIYLLDIDGIRIVHNGDNNDRSQEKKLENYPAANIIIGSTWNNVQSLLTAAQAAQGAESANQIFIPAHENELQHTVGHRESYHEMFAQKVRLGNPDYKYPKTILLDLGESFTYPIQK
jgi:L-ascorbate metabolism protein UlaG (beta-lactamase superfamily)